MARQRFSNHQRQRVFLWGLLLACGLIVPVTTSLYAATIYIALIATLLAAVALIVWSRVERLLMADELLGVTLAVAGDAAAFGLFQSLGKALRSTIANQDPIYRDLAFARLRRLNEEAVEVAAGRIEYIGTEAWRTAYEILLRSRGLYRYRSVAYARTPNYWQDEPGRQSMRVNFEMIQNGLLIERVVIVPDAFWPAGELEPVEPVGRWIEQQVRGGVCLSIVRDSLLEGDPDLLADFGLYGNRAVGFQQVDDHGRTVRFSLSFDFAELLAAERRWDRLAVYATRYDRLPESMLDKK